MVRWSASEPGGRDGDRHQQGRRVPLRFTTRYPRPSSTHTGACRNFLYSVKAAALAQYPGAKIVRLETDTDGVREAHMNTTAGEDKIVQVGKDFTVTCTQTGGGGDHEGDGPGAKG